MRNLALLYALYQLCSQYHSGQWSRGYRLLCRTQNALRRRGIREPLPYSQLPEEFRDELAHYLWKLRGYRFSL